MWKVKQLATSKIPAFSTRPSPQYWHAVPNLWLVASSPLAPHHQLDPALPGNSHPSLRAVTAPLCRGTSATSQLYSYRPAHQATTSHTCICRNMF